MACLLAFGFFLDNHPPVRFRPFYPLFPLFAYKYILVRCIILLCFGIDSVEKLCIQYTYTCVRVRVRWPSLIMFRKKNKKAKNDAPPPTSPNASAGPGKIAPPVPPKLLSETEHAAVIVQRNVRGHLSRKHNEGAQADLRKAKYRRDMGWDRPPSPIVVPTEAATPTPQKDTTPMELSRVQILVEDIRKLQGENKLLQAKHDKMSKVLIREKRQRTKAEADSIRHQRKIKDSQATIEKLKQALNRLGKEKREADMRHLEARKKVDASIEEKAELVMELDKAGKAKNKAIKAARDAEKEAARVARESPRKRGEKGHRRQSSVLAAPQEAMDSSAAGAANGGGDWPPSDHHRGDDDGAAEFRRMKRSLERAVHDRARAVQGFKTAMGLCKERESALERVVKLVRATSKKVPPAANSPQAFPDGTEGTVAPVRPMSPEIFHNMPDSSSKARLMGGGVASPSKAAVANSSPLGKAARQRRQKRQQIERKNMAALRRKQTGRKKQSGRRSLGGGQVSLPSL